MTSIHFAERRQGRGPRLPRAGRAAVCGCVIGVGLSQFFYPRVRVDLCRPAEIETSRDRALVKRVKARVVAGGNGPEAENLFRSGMDLLIRIAKTLGESTNDGA